MKSVWQSDKITNELEKLLGYLNGAYYVRQTSSSTYILVLYLIVGFFGLQIVGFALIGYLIQNQKNVSTIILRPVRYVWTFLNTILFVPVIEILLTILNCSTNPTDNNSYNTFFPDIQCWMGTHIAHSAVSIAVLIFYMIFNCLYNGLYFDGLCLEIKGKNKRNGRANIVMSLNQMVIVILFNFLNQSTYKLVLMIYMILGYFLVFIQFHFFSPYTFLFVKKFYKVITCLSLWNSFILLIADVHFILKINIIFYFLGRRRNTIPRNTLWMVFECPFAHCTRIHNVR